MADDGKTKCVDVDLMRRLNASIFWVFEVDSRYLDHIGIIYTVNNVVFT